MDMPASVGPVDAAYLDADPGDVLARADALRDRRDWAEAAQAYAEFLRLRPSQWSIWVQYGHCMKECGDPKSALLLYREAERLEPADADVNLQIGHALKLLGRPEESRQAYARALALDSDNAFARTELLALEPPVHAAPVTAPQPTNHPAAAPASPPATVFEASDLLEWFRHNRVPTGIQRVQLDIVQAAVRADPEGIGIIGFDPAGGAWKAIPAALFGRLADLSRSGAGTADAAWREATAAAAAVLAEAPPAAFAPGATLIQLGTSWWIPDYLRQVRAAKARFGLRYVPMLYDCIPLVVPEHCAQGLVDEFARWFAGACLHADAVLCISECTRADFRRLQRALLPDVEIPAFVVPLQAAPWLPAGDPPPPPRARPYVLFVGTIESRKNHLLAFHAWLTLVRRHGPDAVPDLVCVGKLGWMAEAALALHANSPELRGRVHLLQGVADGYLAALYRGCLFTLYNSFYEGWGLPVTESLAYGKVPLVPDHSSLREAGGEGALYFTPQSEPDLVAKLERLIFEADFRQTQEASLRRVTRLRSWDDLTVDLLRHAAAAAGPALPPPLARLGVRMGEIHDIRLIAGPVATRRMAAADAVREGPGWLPLEDWGVWTASGGSVLRLPVEAGRLRVHLEFLAPPLACRFGVRARPGPFRSVDAAANERVFCVLETEADTAGDLLVEIETAAPVMLPRNGRQVGIGVCGVMVCRPDDHSARLDYLEAKALGRMVRL